ncbi:hypothetical protein KFE94_07255 [bacterium SCSIO 12643]|nr:hypothetical protein KFE94_16725 [bacterium SCSIO 12643]UTW67903.1 hypothetical protein KFE94_07255 [bacterium SCSIO 12643]
MKRIRPLLKTASYGMLILFVNQIMFPMYSYAITGHSSMPEYSSFEPVSTTNMVNEFDGSFTYNLPLLNVPNGYPVNLSYHSNSVNNEALSSWVGLGWNINPGVINRNKKGFPDEYDGAKVTYYNRMPANWTIGAKLGVNIDIFAKETSKGESSGLIGANISQTISFNNYNGLGTSLSFGASDFAGVANINASFSNGKYNGATYSINPMNALNAFSAKDRPLSEEDAKGKSEIDKLLLTEKQKEKDTETMNKGKESALSFFNPSFGPSFRPIPVSVSESMGVMTSIKLDVGAAFAPVPIKGQWSATGTFSMQKNKYEVKEETVYGYLNTEKAQDDPKGLMDYTMEMESHLEKNDEVLGYPLANADNYSLSGEAFGGSFEAVRGDFGYFRPNEIRSEDIGVDFGAGFSVPLNFIPGLANLEFGYGGSIASNYHQTDIGEWEEFMGVDQSFKSESSFEESQEKVFYLFAGDLAGYFDLTERHDVFNDAPYSPTLTGNVSANDNSYGGFRMVNFRSDGKHKQRSTHIVTHTNEDFSKLGKRSSPYRTYEKGLEYYNGSSYEDYDYGDYPAGGIAEIVTTNKDGLIYVYGLPVYERNEQNIQYGLESSDYSGSPNVIFSEDGLIAMLDKSQFSDSGAKRKVGQKDGNMYATTYLLTQILTPDYIDRTGDGPSEDDFGSYTQFKYERVHGGDGSDAWYGHRSPYIGVSLSSGSLSTNRDDMGSFGYGEKEVYLLHEVHSKTHVAKFKKSSRSDGQSVGLPNGSSAEAIAEWDGSTGTRKSLKKLDEIELYAKQSDDGSLSEELSSVHFKYDYTLANGLPNNSSSSGKLTLKKVWVEHGGISKNRIQPYEFVYEYPNITSYPISAQYPSSDQVGRNINDFDHGDIPVGIQHPNYMSVNTDGWGQYCNYDEDKSDLNYASKNLKRFFPFNNQDPDYSKFDPAAYLLKQIKLPSGGEIHVQYEQHEYAYVQNRNAMVMVPLHSDTDVEETNNKLYYIDIEKIGLSTPNTKSEREALAKKLFEPMIEGDRMYFKFLYALIGDTPDSKRNHTDYIEGFSVISSYGFKDGYFFFSFDERNPNTSSPEFDNPVNNPGKTSKREIPRKVCKDFYKSQRRLLVDGGQNVVGLTSAVDGGSEKGMAKSFLGILESAASGVVEKCKYMDPEMSYVRLNLPLGTGDYRKPGKKAGGARVKRLLMYEDGGMLSDPATVYGTEYLYTLDDNGQGISSGVATNESGSIKMENPWVHPIDKSDISLGESILGSSYLYKHMGPIGFGFMPGPSIGYSKVTSRSIHPGKTGTGKTVKEFYTAKDYPCFMENPSVDAPPPNYGRTPQLTASLGVPGFSVTNEEFSATQGIVVHLNDMHGKPKMTRVLSNDGKSLVSSTEYKYMHYEKRGDDQSKTVQLMGDNMAIKTARLGDLGRKVSVHGYSKSIVDENVSVRATLDTDGPGGIAYPGIPIPIPGILAKLADLSSPVKASYTRTKYNTASVSKVVEHTSIPTEVITVNDGIRTHTVNRVYDDYTGDAVVTTYKDDFKEGVYLDQKFKAMWNYKGMRSKYQNEGLVIEPSLWGLSSITGNTSAGLSTITFNATSSSNFCGLEESFQVGDFLEINDKACLYHVTDVDALNNKLVVQRSMHSTSTLPSNISRIEILRSGYTNQMNTMMGQTVFFSPEGVPNYYSTPSGISYGTNQFINDLNQATTNLSSTPSQPIVLYGPYTEVDLSSFSVINCEGMSIRNVKVDVIIDQTSSPIKTSFSIVSYEYSCDGKSYTLYHCGEGGLGYPSN